VSEPQRESRLPWYIAGAAVLAAAAVLIAGLVSGGGSEDKRPSRATAASEEALPPHVVRTSEIEAQEAGSPERALLEWWQSFQFGDARGVVDRTSEATIGPLGESQLAELVTTRGQGLQGIEVLGASVDGNAASVRAGLLTFQPAKEGGQPPDTPTASRPTTVAMTKEGDEWLFRETALLRPMIEGLRSRREQNQRGEQRQTETQATETAPE
jgi:hypothetical protein